MLERRRRILEAVHRGGGVLVRDLARSLKVTEETIRKDLGNLEEEGKLRRSHGGAVPLDDSLEQPYAERQVQAAAEKAAIAAEAAARVTEGDLLMLDASSTALELARRLPPVRLTVVTPSLQVQMELAGRDSITVIGLGGQVHGRSLSTVGPQAERNVEAYHASLFFLSCKGLDPALGASESSEFMARMKQAMAARAERRILLADHTKLGVKSLTPSLPLSALDEVITDRGASRALLAPLRRAARRVTTAP